LSKYLDVISIHFDAFSSNAPSYYSHNPYKSDPREEHDNKSIDVSALQAENMRLKQQVEALQKNTQILRSVSQSHLFHECIV
jgi:N-acetylmuramoyl-L-alanine amidase